MAVARCGVLRVEQGAAPVARPVDQLGACLVARRRKGGDRVAATGRVDQVQRRGGRRVRRRARGRSLAGAQTRCRAPGGEHPARTDLRPRDGPDRGLHTVSGRRGGRRNRCRCRRRGAARGGVHRGRIGRRRAPGHHHRRQRDDPHLTAPCTALDGTAGAKCGSWSIPFRRTCGSLGQQRCEFGAGH